MTVRGLCLSFHSKLHFRLIHECSRFVITPKSLSVLYSMYEGCDVIETTALGRHEDIPRVIAEESDCAPSLPELCANDSSVAGVSSGMSGYYGNYSGAGVPLS